jgi:hypothetical protein
MAMIDPERRFGRSEGGHGGDGQLSSTTPAARIDPEPILVTSAPGRYGQRWLSGKRPAAGFDPESTLQQPVLAGAGILTADAVV